MSLQESLPSRLRLSPALDLLPGLLLTAMLAALAWSLHGLPLLGVFSPMILAILLGMVFHNLIGTPVRARAGVAFALRRVLRLGIILLGLQLTAAQVAAVGAGGVAIIAAALIGTFFFTKAVGRWLGIDPKLAELIAAGTSICGASAVIATNTVTRGRDEDVAYAVACVTVFGSIAMFVYPLIGAALHLDAQGYGLWTGSSIHEIAQVVAAAFQLGDEAGQAGTIAKLTRVMMLAPMILALGWVSMRSRVAHEHKHSGALPLPWFILGFLALVGLNSVIEIDPPVRAAIVQFTGFLLAMALAAMGLGADFKKLVAAGPRPLLLGAVSSVFISGFSLALVVLAR
ncbi:YeiH family protein [Dongia sedimenti]|uniref:YeiH family protein n=1 Tax=Dongia sedimenti TaxID=3064282 RepID=A0ABU0YT18_9PROT|nr:YeiH family protein [Rhodospirillaceae bacterium R-7]